MQCAGERGRMLLECARPRRGLPHSKTLARESKPLDLAKLLDCATQGARSRKNALRFVAGIDSVHWLFE